MLVTVPLICGRVFAVVFCLFLISVEKRINGTPRSLLPEALPDVKGVPVILRQD